MPDRVAFVPQETWTVFFLMFLVPEAALDVVMQTALYQTGWRP